MRKVVVVLAVLLLAIVIWLAFAPVPIAPVAWDAPPSPGFAGPFAENDRLTAMELLSLGEFHGSEDVAIGPDGKVYGSVESGIVRMNRDGSGVEMWTPLDGRPLGIDFAADGTLIVANSMIGLQAVAPDRSVTLLATGADGVEFGHVNDVDVAADGRIWFTDASLEFPPREFGDTYEASLLDLMEHGGHGMLAVFDPATARASIFARGFQFANGLAVGHDQQFVVVGECGAYTVTKVWIDGPRAGEREHVLENLPGFTDNISTGMEGRFWVALISPRNPIVDALSGRPGLRKAIQRLPRSMRPDAVPYVHVIAFDEAGTVIASLQDPSGRLPSNSSVIEDDEYIWLGSLRANAVGRLEKEGLF